MTGPSGWGGGGIAAATQVLAASGGLARDAQRPAGEVEAFILRVRPA